MDGRAIVAASGALMSEPQVPASITPYPDGPLIVRGDFEIVDVDGVVEPNGRRTVALCRCGVSSIKPFCDGTHKLVKFRSGDS